MIYAKATFNLKVAFGEALSIFQIKCLVYYPNIRYDVHIQKMEDSHMTYQNPYLPLWEHLPDGEARVFDDPNVPGKQRLYVVGSHDTRNDSYCGTDVRIWSAPTEDLTDWRDEGPVFSYQAPNGLWDVMYAPDLVEVKYRNGEKAYFLYPHSRGPGREALVCKGPTPVGPFTPCNLAENGADLLPGSFIGFDPSVFVEQIDDPTDPDYEIGFRAYVYYGFQNSFAAQLDQSTMWSVRPGTEIIEHFIPSSHSYGNLCDPEGTTYPHVQEVADRPRFNFFEASSIRKVGNKYVLVFSGYSGPDYGLESTNSSLRYGYGDSPLGPWKAGGVLVDSRGPMLNEDGSALETVNDHHNTHGGLEQVNGNWYVFYHRPPRGYGFTRQAMAAQVKIDWDETPVAEGGTVTIRAYDPYAENEIWTAKATNGHEYTGVQVASEGLNPYGLAPYNYYSAGIASYLSRTEILTDNFDIWDNHMPLTGVQDGDRIGFFSFDFRNMAADTVFNLWVKTTSSHNFELQLWLDGPWDNATWKGKQLGTLQISGDQEHYTLPLDLTDLTKKQPLFLVAKGPAGNLCDIHGLGFSSAEHPISKPVVPTVGITLNGQALALPEHPTPSTILNGYQGFDIYEMSVELPAATKEIPEIQGTADASVTVSIEPLTEVFGTAIVKFDYHEKVKTYKITTVPPSNLEEPTEYFISQSNPIYEGSAREQWNDEITGFNEPTAAVAFTIDVPEAGQYELQMSHNAMTSTSVHQYVVNDGKAVEMTYRYGGWLTSALPETVQLKQGQNTIRIQHQQGQVDLRLIVLRKVIGQS